MIVYFLQLKDIDECKNIMRSTSKAISEFSLVLTKSLIKYNIFLAVNMTLYYSYCIMFTGILCYYDFV